MLDWLKNLTLRRRTTGPDPIGGRGIFFTFPTAGIWVDEERALRYAAVWACVRIISETLASLPWGVFRERPDGGRDGS